MTIRGGGRPRDSQAHPQDPEPAWLPAVGRGGTRNGFVAAGRRDPRHTLRFLVFALALAALVLLALVTVLRPILVRGVVAWADDNPSALHLPFVADLVREDLGSALTTPGGTSDLPVEFDVNPGDTLPVVAARLRQAGLVANERAFLFEATLDDLGSRLEAGRYLIAGNLTPGDVAAALSPEHKITVTTVEVTFREGLRLEQLVAKLQTVPSGVDPKRFYDLVTKPPASLVDAYPFLADRSWKSLEGFLYPATYTLRTDAQDPTTADDLVRMMLDQFAQHVDANRLAAAKKAGGLDKVLVLASIVEREAALDDERALIAGVYQNRLDHKPTILNADPTILYGIDTLNLRSMPFEEWQTYYFWKTAGRDLNTVDLPGDLAGFQTYQRAGLPPAPICTPSDASIDAALDPNTKPGYFYFVAIPDGGGKHAFAKTAAQFDELLHKYGYR
ncbi:MAG TPA: endolytic transglycosylase MltG [Candidatus Limnocylindrales bacterium]|nr:endolytic transglycosylase MltG [Candidatus Limnocylindrales bacterium]